MTEPIDIVERGAGCARKTRYDTEQRAKDIALKCWYERGESLRAYECPKCAGWHLTKSNAPPMMKPGWRPPEPSREQRARDRRAGRRRRRRWQ